MARKNMPHATYAEISIPVTTKFVISFSLAHTRLTITRLLNMHRISVDNETTKLTNRCMGGASSRDLTYTAILRMSMPCHITTHCPATLRHIAQSHYDILPMSISHPRQPPPMSECPKKHKGEPIHSTYLAQFYSTLFPTHMLAQFLRLQPTREISFTKTGDRMIRYLSFSTADELYRALVRDVPVRIDVGCQYTSVPVVGGNNVWMERELVFDIDMAEHAECGETCVCTDRQTKDKQMKDRQMKENGKDNDKDRRAKDNDKDRHAKENETVSNADNACMMAVINKMKHILTTHFGFTSVHFFFSGSKGFHCYVLDSITYQFMPTVRQAVAVYLKNHGISVDESVTRDPRHLLKAPFCVHPKTGYVCVPVIDRVERISVQDAVHGSDRYSRLVEHFIDVVDGLHH